MLSACIEVCVCERHGVSSKRSCRLLWNFPCLSTEGRKEGERRPCCRKRATKMVYGSSLARVFTTSSSKRRLVSLEERRLGASWTDVMFWLMFGPRELCPPALVSAV